jgi:dUTP pyrophosphatase
MSDTLIIQTTLPDGSPYPTYGTDQSVGLDLPLQEDVYVAPQSTVMTDTGFIVQWPEGVFGMIVPRSSTGKKGVMLANTLGIVDPDYRGPRDTVKLLLRNLTDEAVHFKKGDRLAQVVLVPYLKLPNLQIDWYDNIEEIEGESRGGFGSTGQ